MNICIATYGSRGDVQPVIVLGLRLREAGHGVFLAAPPENQPWVSSFGLSFLPLGAPFMDFTERHPGVHSLRPALCYLRFLREQARLQFEPLLRFLRGADLALGCSLTFAMPSVAQVLTVPYRYIVFCPQVLRSVHHPSLFAKNHRMPKSLNRLTWKADSLADRLLFRPAIDRCRKKLGLAPIAGTTLDHLLADRPLLAAERILAPVPPDVGKQVVRIGYPHLAGGGQLGKAVEDFLAEGPAPVYCGFGSMPDENREKTLSCIRSAARRAKMRIIVSWGKEKRVARDCLLVGPLDHERLFSKTAMVVHHGGAGTTATAARAGVPQILVPHVLDQFYWARRVEALGLGPAPLCRGRLRSRALAGRMAAVAGDSAYRKRAEALAGRLAQEQTAVGMQDAVDALLPVRKAFRHG